MLRIALAILAALTVVVSAHAQQKPQRVTGTIEKVDGAMVMLKGKDGAPITVKMADNATVVAVIKSSLADIKAGSFVGSTAMPEADGTWKAVEVHIFPESMRGTGEGDRPFDYHPKSTMTNATVGDVVSKVEGGTMTMKFKGGEKKIDVVPSTLVVTYIPGNKDELKPGAKVVVLGATKQDDGSFTTARLNVGRDGVAPPLW
ncbi:MAG TPA: hypothetical protein VFB45_24085 [Pseudolabrys sp.]|nr:hypothetical protein [Pseudolabrys sp.]